MLKCASGMIMVKEKQEGRDRGYAFSEELDALLGL